MLNPPKGCPPTNRGFYDRAVLPVTIRRQRENRNVGVGVFPQREEILVGGAGFGCVALQGVGSGKAEVGECADGFVDHDAALAINRKAMEDALKKVAGELGREYPLTIGGEKVFTKEKIHSTNPVQAAKAEYARLQ